MIVKKIKISYLLALKNSSLFLSQRDSLPFLRRKDPFFARGKGSFLRRKGKQGEKEVLSLEKKKILLFGPFEVQNGPCLLDLLKVTH